MKSLQFRLIPIATPAYEEMMALRMKVLLDPIGIPRSYIDPVKEAADLLLGAYLDERLVACCILTRVSDEVVQLRQMAVETFLQKQGTGAALLSYAETVANEKGYSQMIMHARDTVLPFYSQCGYAVCSEQFFEVGIAHHKMCKELQG
ncbi:MAG TPA: GNAT family N-acetyltransferase [Flavisolibacter sp.]|nr:GNAT family N-acetyltransferase [Flavisolibacter sp.]